MKPADTLSINADSLVFFHKVKYIETFIVTSRNNNYTNAMFRKRVVSAFTSRPNFESTAFATRQHSYVAY